MRRGELIFEVADRHQITAREVVRMVHLVCFGVEGARQIEEVGLYDPISDLHLDLARVDQLLAERPSIPELLDLWQHCRDVCAALAERQTDLTKRAAMFAALVECEARMAALRERLVQRVERDAAGLGAK
jgi:hypothetical protein